MTTEQRTFEQFMRNYQNMVFTTAVRLLADEGEAQDISQEVFLKAYERFDELQTSPTAGGWLKTVTTNMCLNHLSRFRNRWRYLADIFPKRDDEDDEQPLELPSADTTTEQVAEADQRRILEEALLKLPANQRVPLVLYHFEQKSYEEIARETKVSLAKVKTDVMRGRQALRKKLMLAGGGGRELLEDYEPKAQPGRKQTFTTFTRMLSPKLL